MAEQKIIKEYIKNNLNDDLLKNALDLIAYLRANDVSPDSPDSNSFYYLGKSVCVICIFNDKAETPDPWVMFFNGGDVCEPVNLQVDGHLLKQMYIAARTSKLMGKSAGAKTNRESV